MKILNPDRLKRRRLKKLFKLVLISAKITGNRAVIMKNTFGQNGRIISKAIIFNEAGPIYNADSFNQLEIILDKLNNNKDLNSIDGDGPYVYNHKIQFNEKLFKKWTSH